MRHASGEITRSGTACGLVEVADLVEVAGLAAARSPRNRRSTRPSTRSFYR